MGAVQKIRYLATADQFAGKRKIPVERKAGEKLAEALDVGVDWLLFGDEGKKRYPADKKLIEWLWEHPEVREELWKKMDEEE